MPIFKDFKIAVQQQMDNMAKHELFRTNVEKDLLWETYLRSFPPGTNNIFRERPEHDCQCCKQFIRSAGNMVTVVDGAKVSIWDVNVGGYYQVVADALATLVKSASIADAFLHNEHSLGTDYNHQETEDGQIMKWDHFYYKLPAKFVKQDESIATILGDIRSSKNVFKRSLEEISIESIETVIELIGQNSLYRGDENLHAVEQFLAQSKAYHADQLQTPEEKDIYCWTVAKSIGVAARIRNTAIGTLLTDISAGMDLDAAVRSFETKVAPMNYKRSSAVVSKGMIEKAQKKVAELGIENSLQRRYATKEDITVNNILFADRSVKKSMDVFDEMADAAQSKVSNLDKVEEVSIATFINSILPKAESVELLLENSHGNNLMSLIAPQNDAPNILKWDNNFSWNYNGEVTDSIKERVKKAGGSVTGDLRCSLSWFNYDDLDIHVVEPDKNHIYFVHKRSSNGGGVLDVDMNVNSRGSRNAVENVTWPNKCKMQEGGYHVYIHNYCRREKVDVGFDVEIEFDGNINTFHYGKPVNPGMKVTVAKFNYSHQNGVKFIESLPSTQAVKEIWSIPTQKFHKVSMIMNSPNHWNGECTGNKHWFFILDKCKNDKPARGLFNEFLRNELNEHRKVFEVLGSKMKAEPTDNQLSGLGFSSTQRNHVFCKVTGSFTRTIKINF